MNIIYTIVILSSTLLGATSIYDLNPFTEATRCKIVDCQRKGLEVTYSITNEKAIEIIQTLFAKKENEQ